MLQKKQLFVKIYICETEKFIIIVKLCTKRCSPLSEKGFSDKLWNWLVYFFVAEKIEFPNFFTEPCYVAARRRDFVADPQPEFAISLDTPKRNLHEIAFLLYDS